MFKVFESICLFFALFLTVPVIFSFMTETWQFVCYSIGLIFFLFSGVFKGLKETE